MCRHFIFSQTDKAKSMVMVGAEANVLKMHKTYHTCPTKCLLKFKWYPLVYFELDVLTSNMGHNFNQYVVK